jgi:serine/threonine protein phosphatase PrpC
MTLALRYAVRSDVGLLREGNEDSAYAGPHLLAVADGMGGHAAGEVASAATITTIAALDTEHVGQDLANALAGAVASANMRLQELIIADPATEGMGTTLTAILWVDGHAALCHIGDSRAYLLRSGQFYQITHDHTLVQSLVDEGKITEDDVATHPHRSLLLRALDGRTVAEPDLSVHETMPGDRYLLCSDGLSGVVTEQTLHQTLRSVWDPDKAALQLIELAIKGGGPDNITCIVADVIDTATSNAPATRNPSMAGAAVNGPPGGGPGDSRNGHPDTSPGVPERASSPASRAMNLTRTKPQPAVSDDDGWGGYNDGDTVYGGSGGPGGGGHGGPGGPGGPGGAGLGGAAEAGADGNGPYDSDSDFGPAAPKRKRRLPIVTAVVILLVLVIGGGLIGGWQYVQGQYYIGVSNGAVAVYRGVDQSVAGISLSSLAQSYPNLPMAQLDSGDQSQVSQTISYTSLQSAQAIVTRLQQSANSCRQSYQALAAWQVQNQNYQAALTSYNRLPAAQKRGRPKPTPPAAEPATVSAAECAPPAAFGIAASALPAQSGGENPAANPSSSPAAHTTAPAPGTKITPSPGKSA